MPRVFCSLCQCETSHYHENQHRKQAATPFTSSNTSSSFLVNSVESDSDSGSSLFSPVASEVQPLDFTQNMFSLDSSPKEVSNINDHIRAWLYGTYPAAEIYDSDCGEDRESWMKQREQEDTREREETRIVDDERAQELKPRSGQVEISEEVDSESEFWDSDHHLESDTDSEASEHGGFDWDAFERAATGIAAFDKLGEDFEVDIANLANRLSELDLAICKAYAWKVRSHTADEYYATAPDAFGPRTGNPLPNIRAQRGRLSFLSGFKPREYHCCVNSCMCFTGVYSDKQQCSYCKENRLNVSGKPRRIFTYIPLIPRLQALFSNRDMAEKMTYRYYRHGRSNVNSVEDIFDGEIYKSLLKESVRVGETTYERSYFTDPREIALGLSTDGFAPFKKRSKTAWPIILINYNLPPDIRCHLGHILSLGVIPGPSKPHNWDSFIWPLMEELAILASNRGVPTVDILHSALFPLRAHLIAAFGDIPAISMLMKMKGHNGKCPCRLCAIEALRVPGGGTTHYVPLNRSSHPDVTSGTSKVRSYDPLALPLHTPTDFLAQAAEVESQKTKAAAECLSKQYGIKGMPLLSFLGSLKFPTSLPYDFMHMVFENLLPNLVLHWTGDFKGMDEGDEDYVLAGTVWQAIGLVTAKAGDTIPSAYGGRVPDIHTKKYEMNAERWSFWALYIAPIVLRRRFSNPKYYKHFVDLVVLINMCLQFEISHEEIDNLEKGFAKWVEDYERIYYQYDPERLPACPLTIHALLHIAQSIRDMGPVWCYWAFVMERYCGTLTPDIKSRRFPFASLDRNVVERAQLTQIGLTYNITRELSYCRKVTVQHGAFECADYPTIRLLPPRLNEPPPLNLIQYGIAASLATRFDAKITNVRAVLKNASIEQYGAVKLIDSEEGDTLRCSSLYKPPKDSRDPTFVRYEMYVDLYTNKKKAKPKYVLQTFYGQLQHLFLVRLSNPASPAIRKPLGVKDDEVLQSVYVLAGCRRCTIKEGTSAELERLDMHLYSNHGPLDVVDVMAVQSLVGRVPDIVEKWAIIDRSGSLARAVAEEQYAEEDENI